MSHQRIVIVGGPDTGKTTLAEKLSRETPFARVRSTDELIEQTDWSGVSRIVAEEWLEEPGPWVIEGVATARALRKWLQAHPDTGAPCDKVIVLAYPKVAEQKPGQVAMGKGVLTVFTQIAATLQERGVEVELEEPPK